MNRVELTIKEGLFIPKPAVPRSEGCHVSQIIRSIENEVLKPGQRKPLEELTSDEKRRMGAYTTGGWAWEEVIREAVVKMYLANDSRFIPVGELEEDGIYGTPDWFDAEDWCVEEFKATWRSSRRLSNFDEEFWSWLAQIKAYCHMIGTLSAKLRVFFVNGDYRSSGPQVRMFHLEFDEEEVESNWQMILNYAREKGWI